MSDVTEATLRAAIFAAPADDGPREVYADWLLERGDPFGEYIVRQLRIDTTAFDARAHELYMNHRERILGPLDRHVLQPPVMARGFVTAATLAGDEVQRHTVPALPEWATLHSVERGLPATDAHPMPILQRLAGADLFAVSRLAALAAPPPIAHLTAFVGRYEVGSGFTAHARATQAAFAALALPALRHLELEAAADDYGPDTIGWAWQARTGLTRLTVAAAAPQLASWLAAVAPTAIVRIRLVALRYTNAWWIDAERDAAGAPRWRVTATCSRPERVVTVEAVELLAGSLAMLPPDLLDALAIPKLVPQRWRATSRRAMQRALANQPRVDPALVTGYTPPRRRADRRSP